MESLDIVVECPVCGRPSQIQEGHIGRTLVCGQCRGSFVAVKTLPGAWTTSERDRPNLLEEKTTMLNKTKETGMSHLPLICNATAVSRRPSAHADRRESDWQQPPPCVLVVEFRDNVYRALRSLLESRGLHVLRARRGAEVATKTRDFVPELVLIYEDMPDESGWLIACKLRFGLNSDPIWLYTARWPRSLADRQKATGVDQVIQCGQSQFQFLDEVQTRIAEWRTARSRPDVTSALRLGSA